MRRLKAALSSFSLGERHILHGRLDSLLLETSSVTRPGSEKISSGNTSNLLYCKAKTIDFIQKRFLSKTLHISSNLISKNVLSVFYNFCFKQNELDFPEKLVLS